MATSAAVTIMTVFMMLIPLCWAPGRADRVTPLFRFVCARRPLLPSHVPAPSPGEMAPDYLSLWRWNGSNAIGRIGEGRRLTKCSHSMVGGNDEVTVHCHHSFTVRLQPAHLTTADESNLPRAFLGVNGRGNEVTLPRAPLAVEGSCQRHKLTVSFH
jgi:hypothetical protein